MKRAVALLMIAVSLAVFSGCSGRMPWDSGRYYNNNGYYQDDEYTPGDFYDAYGNYYAEGYYDRYGNFYAADYYNYDYGYYEGYFDPDGYYHENNY